MNKLQEFCNIFDNLFNEWHLIPILHKYYRQSVIVSGSSDHTIKIWNFDGTLLNTLIGHTGCALTIALC